MVDLTERICVNDWKHLQMRGIFLYTAAYKEVRWKHEATWNKKILLECTGTKKKEHQQTTLRCHRGWTKHRQILQHNSHSAQGRTLSCLLWQWRRPLRLPEHVNIAEDKFLDLQNGNLIWQCFIRHPSSVICQIFQVDEFRRAFQTSSRTIFQGCQMVCFQTKKYQFG
jgi:hypothetical protein